MAHLKDVEAAAERAQFGGEPVIKAEFVNSVRVRIKTNTGNVVSEEHTALSAAHDKYKGRLEMVLTSHGIRIRSVDTPNEVLLVPMANIRSLVTLGDYAWSQARYEDEQAAKSA